MVCFRLEDPEITYGLWNGTTRYDNTPAIWSSCEATSSEDEFFDTDIFEYVVFFYHEKVFKKSQTFRMGL